MPLQLTNIAVQQYQSGVSIVGTVSAADNIEGILSTDNLARDGATDSQLITWVPELSTWTPLSRDSTYIFNSKSDLSIHGGTISGIGVYAPFAWGSYNFNNIDDNRKLVGLGASHTMHINQSGVLKGQGLNTYGQLGVDPTLYPSAIEPINLDTSAAAKTWKKVSCGGYFTIAIDYNDKLWTWGNNNAYQLGRETTTEYWKPGMVGNKNWAEIAAGHNFSAAIDTDGNLYVWGNMSFSTTIAPIKKFPVQISTSKKWKTVSCGFNCMAAIDTSGKLYTMGTNEFGQLGIGEVAQTTAPARTALGELAGTFATYTWKDISCGGKHMAAIDSQGRLFAWGGASEFALAGNGSFATNSTPSQITNPKIATRKWIQVASNSQNSLAIDEAGDAYIWGRTHPIIIAETLEPITINVVGLGVTVSKYEITVGQWKRFALETDWLNLSSVPYTPESWQDDSHPVVNISWDDAQLYCKWLSHKTRKVWRLPTNLEWDKIVGHAIYPWEENVFPDDAKLSTLGNYSTPGDSYAKTAPVGRYKPNSIGFYDLGGNVSEMTHDVFVQNGTKIARGSNYTTKDPAKLQSLAYEVIPSAKFISPSLGFRVVRESDLNSHELISIPNKQYAVSKYETTINQWKTFVSETGWNKNNAWKDYLNKISPCPKVVIGGSYAIADGWFNPTSSPKTLPGGEVSNWDIVCRHERGYYAANNDVSSIVDLEVPNGSTYAVVYKNSIYVVKPKKGDFILKYDGTKWTAVAYLGTNPSARDNLLLDNGFSNPDNLSVGLRFSRTGMTLPWTILSNSSIYPLLTLTGLTTYNVSWCNTFDTSLLPPTAPLPRTLVNMAIYETTIAQWRAYTDANGFDSKKWIAGEPVRKYIPPYTSYNTIQWGEWYSMDSFTEVEATVTRGTLMVSIRHPNGTIRNYASYSAYHRTAVITLTPSQIITRGWWWWDWWLWRPYNYFLWRNWWWWYHLYTYTHPHPNVPGSQFRFTNIYGTRDYIKSTTPERSYIAYEDPVASRPVTKVTWQEAQAYCRWLTKKTGKICRLPTEDEWIAATNYSAYGHGNNWPPTATDGNYNVTSDGYSNTAPATTYTPNVLGMYNLGGNVWEWIADRSAAKGGSYKTTATDKFVSNSLPRETDVGYEDIGFRIVVEEATTELSPVTNISQDDARDYCKWLALKSDHSWRLPFDAEWSLLCGTDRYPWGSYFPLDNNDGNYGIIPLGTTVSVQVEITPTTRPVIADVTTVGETPTRYARANDGVASITLANGSGYYNISLGSRTAVTGPDRPHAGFGGLDSTGYNIYVTDNVMKWSNSVYVSIPYSSSTSTWSVQMLAGQTGSVKFNILGDDPAKYRVVESRPGYTPSPSFQYSPTYVVENTATNVINTIGPFTIPIVNALDAKKAFYTRTVRLTALDVDSYSRTAPVGSFKPNSAGFYDLGGNVWEWTANQTYVPSTPLTITANITAENKIICSLTDNPADAQIFDFQGGVNFDIVGSVNDFRVVNTFKAPGNNDLPVTAFTRNNSTSFTELASGPYSLTVTEDITFNTNAINYTIPGTQKAFTFDSKALRGRVGVGSAHTVAISSNGAVWAWGYNKNGRLGDGTETIDSKVVRVTMPPARYLVTEQRFTLAITTDNDVYAWGAPSLYNVFYYFYADAAKIAWYETLKGTFGLNYQALSALPSGSDDSSYGPVQIAVPKALTVDTDSVVSIVITQTGEVYVWGYVGTLRYLTSNPTVKQIFDPVKLNVPPMKDVAIAKGGYTFAPVSSAYSSTVMFLGQNGTVYMAGGTFTTLSAISINATIRTIEADLGRFVAIDTTNQAWVWGLELNESLGKTTNASDNSKNVSFTSAVAVHTPTKPTLLNSLPIASISLGHATISKLNSSGWFLNDRAHAYSFILDRDGKVHLWGDNVYAQSGLITNTGKNPFEIELLSIDNIMEVAAGGNHSIAVAGDGALSAWGTNVYGQLGFGAASNEPIKVPTKIPLEGVKKAAAADGASMFIGINGGLSAVGVNVGGRLGIGSTTNTTTITRITIPPVSSVAIGAQHSIAVTQTGEVYAWGSNSYNQVRFSVSVNDPAASLTPVKRSVPTAVSVAAGDLHSLVLDASGSVWFSGVHVQRKSGYATDSTATAGKLYLPPVKAIAAGRGHSIFLGVDGMLSAIGDNAYGQLGINDAEVKYVYAGMTNTSTRGRMAIQLDQFPVEIVAIAAGGDQSFAIGADNSLYAWGKNNLGQLGNGLETLSGIPDNYFSPSRIKIDWVTKVTVGYDHAIAIDTHENVRTWGSSEYGQLGDGLLTADKNASIALEHAMTTVLGLPRVVAVNTGFTVDEEPHHAAIGVDGKLYTWGSNTYGQLGDRTTRKITGIYNTGFNCIDSLVQDTTASQVFSVELTKPYIEYQKSLRGASFKTVEYTDLYTESRRLVVDRPILPYFDDDIGFRVMRDNPPSIIDENVASRPVNIQSSNKWLNVYGGSSTNTGHGLDIAREVYKWYNDIPNTTDIKIMTVSSAYNIKSITRVSNGFEIEYSDAASGLLISTSVAQNQNGNVIDSAYIQISNSKGLISIRPADMLNVDELFITLFENYKTVSTLNASGLRWGSLVQQIAGGVNKLFSHTINTASYVFALAPAGGVYKSTDFNIWTSQTINAGSTTNLLAGACNANVCMFGGSGGVTARYADIATLASPTLGTWNSTNAIYSIMAYGNSFLACGANGTAKLLYNTTWYSVEFDKPALLNPTAGTGPTLRNMKTYDNIRFIVGDNSLLLKNTASDVVINSSNITVPKFYQVPLTIVATTITFNDLAYFAGTYILVGNKNTILLATDALNDWVVIKSPFSDPTTNIKTVEHVGDKFIIAGDKGSVAWSTNGTIWIQQLFLSTENITSSTIFNNTIVLGTSVGNLTVNLQ